MNPKLSKLFGWLALAVIILAVAYTLTNNSDSCHVNPFYGDDGCYDKYER